MSRPWNDRSEADAIGVRLHGSRILAGLSQRQLVAGTGYSAAYVSRIEAGARLPSGRFLRTIAPHLGVSVAYLETGDDVIDVRLPAAVVARLAAGKVPASARPILAARCTAALQTVAG